MTSTKPTTFFDSTLLPETTTESSTPSAGKPIKLLQTNKISKILYIKL